MCRSSSVGEMLRFPNATVLLGFDRYSTSKRMPALRPGPTGASAVKRKRVELLPLSTLNQSFSVPSLAYRMARSIWPLRLALSPSACDQAWSGHPRAVASAPNPRAICRLFMCPPESEYSKATLFQRIASGYRTKVLCGCALASEFGARGVVRALRREARCADFGCRLLSHWLQAAPAPAARTAGLTGGRLACATDG